MPEATATKSPKGPSFFYMMNTNTTDRPSYLLDLARDYGDIVKIPGFIRTYLINQPDYIEHVLLKKPKNYIKSSMALKPLMATLGHGLLTSQGEKWTQRRKLLAPMFQPRYTANFTEIIIQTTKRIILNWQSFHEKNIAFDLNHEVMSIVLSIAADAMFSTKLDCLQTKKIIAAIATENHYACTLLPFLPWLPTIGNLRYHRAKKVLQGFIKEMIHEHEINLDGFDDLLSTLLSNKESQQISAQDIFDEAKTFLLTGHETTGTALCWTWYLLGTHPESYQQLEQEIDEVLGRKDVSLEDLPKLTYTRMVFEESMRLYPPIWITGRKTLQDDYLGNYFIPAKSEILICPYVIHRNENYWSQPDAFIPERFLDSKQQSRCAYIPFGAGPRICIASHFAMQMALIIIATIAQHYHLEVIPEQNIELDGLISLKPKHGILVKAKPKKHLNDS